MHAERQPSRLSVIVLAALLLAGCGSEVTPPQGPEALEELPLRAGAFEGRVVQSVRGTPPVDRESELRVEFDEEGRLVSWQGRPLRSYVLERLLEEQRCSGADADALLAPGAVLQVACPEDVAVTFRTLEYHTSPGFGLVVELAADGSPLPTGTGRTRGRGSEFYRLTEEGLDVDVFVELVFDQDEGKAMRIEQRVRGRLQPASD